MDQSQDSQDSQIHKCNLCTATFSKEIYLQIHKRDVHDSARSGNILKRIVINIKQKEYKADDKSIEKEVEKTKVKQDKPCEKNLEKESQSESESFNESKLNGGFENDLYSNNRFINVKEIKIDPYEHIDEESILQQLNEKQQQLEKSDTYEDDGIIHVKSITPPKNQVFQHLIKQIKDPLKIEIKSNHIQIVENSLNIEECTMEIEEKPLEFEIDPLKEVGKENSLKAKRQNRSRNIHENPALIEKNYIKSSNCECEFLPAKCQICQESPFYHFNGLKNHLTIKHDGVESYRCQNCQKTFVEIVKVHMQKLTVDLLTARPNTCMICKKVCLNTQDLFKHKQTFHEGWQGLKVEAKELFDCLICRKYCSKPLHVEVHKHIKDRANPIFPCLECKFEFQAAEDWKKHAKNKCKGIKLNCENCHVSYYEYDPTKTTICKRCLKMSESEEKKRKLSEIKKEKELENKKKQKIFDEEFEKSQNYIGQLDDDFSD